MNSWTRQGRGGFAFIITYLLLLQYLYAVGTWKHGHGDGDEEEGYVTYV